ncbi:hypothetical protein ACWCPQ_09480 [Nocardia sp. NPDC001965]
MGTNFEHVPDDLRGSSDKAQNVVPGVNEHAEGDGDFLSLLYQGAGLGVHGFAVTVPEGQELRKQGWKGLGSGFEAVANTGYTGLTKFEQADLDGKGGVPRGPEAV